MDTVLKHWPTGLVWSLILASATATSGLRYLTDLNLTIALLWLTHFTCWLAATWTALRMVRSFQLHKHRVRYSEYRPFGAVACGLASGAVLGFGLYNLLLLLSQQIAKVQGSPIQEWAGYGLYLGLTTVTVAVTASQLGTLVEDARCNSWRRLPALSALFASH